jgi:hypothetical protein
MTMPDDLRLFSMPVRMKITNIWSIINAPQKAMRYTASRPLVMFMEKMAAIKAPAVKDTMTVSTMTCTMINSFWKVLRRMDT